jgi:hypothetical protein
MKESIQQHAQEVSIIIYDAPLPPRYLRFSKKFIRTLFVAVPVTLGLIFMGLLLWGLGSRLKDTPAPKMPVVVSDQEAQVLELEAEIKTLKESNAQFQSKISALPSAGNEDETYLMAIKKPYGMQNLLSAKKVSVDTFEFIQDPTKTNFKFQITSTNPDTKVIGNIVVFMISEGGLMAYPKEANATLDAGIIFTTGEPFAVSRLRPTNAEFIGRPRGESVKFVIYIFSREGDLLLKKESEAYKVGPKS